MEEIPLSGESTPLLSSAPEHLFADDEQSDNPASSQQANPHQK